MTQNTLVTEVLGQPCRPGARINTYSRDSALSGAAKAVTVWTKKKSARRSKAPWKNCRRKVITESLNTISDYRGFRVTGVDYDAEIDAEVMVNNLIDLAI
jgi:hypothetical protein